MEVKAWFFFVKSLMIGIFPLKWKMSHIQTRQSHTPAIRWTLNYYLAKLTGLKAWILNLYYIINKILKTIKYLQHSPMTFNPWSLIHNFKFLLHNDLNVLILNKILNFLYVLYSLTQIFCELFVWSITYTWDNTSSTYL